MTKEIQGLELDIKQHIGKSLLGEAGKYLETDQSVSEAQIEAFKETIESLPEGELKKLISRLEKVQEIGAKASEAYLNVQDHAWKLAKPLISLGFPLAAFIPDKPFSKLSIKGAKFGAKVTKGSIKVTVDGLDKIKQKLKKGKD